jgi:hypothetical protein
MNARTRQFNVMAVSGLALSAALVSTALAMEWRTAEPDDLKGDFKQPLKEVRGEKMHSKTMIAENNGKDSYKLTIDGDDISAEVNGEKVPAERIRRKDGKVEILDANGGVIKTFNVSGDGNTITVHGMDLGNLGNAGELHRKLAEQLMNGDMRNFDGRVWVGDGPGQGGGGGGGGQNEGKRREFRLKSDGKGGFKVQNDDKVASGWAPAQGGVASVNSTPPPVMIGITMSEPEDSVLEFLNIDNAIRVDRVVEGLPGAAAGLQTGDLIIQVKGEKGIGQERLREILRESKPGDELQLKVARKGNQQDITVKLTAFDQSKLATTVPGVNLQDDVAVVRPPQTRKWDDAQKQLEMAMKALKDNPNLQPEALKKQLDEALSQASEALKSAKDQMRDGMNEMRFRLDQNGDDNVTILRGRDGARLPLIRDMFVAPGMPDSPRVEVRGMRLDSDQRLDALEKKLDEMNKRMDEIRDLLKESKGR